MGFTDSFTVHFYILLLVCLVVSSIGFKKFVYFISLGYGFSIAAEGVTLLLLFRDDLEPATVVMCLLLVVYGSRLGGYLLVRERNSASYQRVMVKEIKDGADKKLSAKIGIWFCCALLYVLQVSPVYFRLESGYGADGVTWVGALIMLGGIALEATADLQKSKAKLLAPHTFCHTGLYKLVRCPNYLGEVLVWTGVFVSAVNILDGFWEWLAALLGYIAIVYIMFGGARRLELRQNRNYGDDPEYQKYVKKTPILLPFVPLYSVAKYKWLVG